MPFDYDVMEKYEKLTEEQKGDVKKYILFMSSDISRKEERPKKSSRGIGERYANPDIISKERELESEAFSGEYLNEINRR